MCLSFTGVMTAQSIVCPNLCRAEKYVRFFYFDVTFQVCRIWVVENIYMYYFGTYFYKSYRYKLRSCIFYSFFFLTHLGVFNQEFSAKLGCSRYLMPQNGRVVK